MKPARLLSAWLRCGISPQGRLVFFFLVCTVWLPQYVSAGAQTALLEDPTHYFKNMQSKIIADGSVEQIEKGKPIVWIVIDALRPDHLGCYGYRRDTSPTLDRLAGDGLTFTRFFANASWTRPATASMHTGLYPSHHGVQCDWHKLPDSLHTVAGQLKKAGYLTLGVVGNGNASSAFGLHRGFDVFEDTTTQWKGLPRAEQVFKLGLDLIKKHPERQKIFLFLFVVDPHDPYKPKPPYDEMFLPGYAGEIVNSPRWEYQNHYAEPVREKTVALYDGLIRYTDDQLSGFLAGLKKLGLFESASIFVTSDHGEAFGEHGVYKHAYHLYETHIRIPLVVHAPWLKQRGRICPAMFQQVDLLPTFCDLAGAEIPASLDGISMLEVLRGAQKLPVPRYVLSEYKCYGIKRSAIRTPVYKLIHQKPADREVFIKHVKHTKFLPSVSFDQETFQLYDLGDDPFEKKNIWERKKADQGLMLLKALRKLSAYDRTADEVRDLDPELVEELKSLGYVQ